MTDLPAGIARSAAAVTAWNALARATGFLRVLAVGAALGVTYLGNTYQSANLVSNVLFEVLAAGLLSTPLVPILVRLTDTREEMARAVGALMAVSAIVLGGVAVVGGALGRPIMMALTSGAPAHVRSAEVALGSFWLWFFLPQLVLYAAGAVATAALAAKQRFAAAAAAPVLNNLCVIGTMALFMTWQRGAGGSLSLSNAERLTLAIGTTGGVLLMSALPVLALARAGVTPQLNLDLRQPALVALRAQAGWALLLLAANQVVVAGSLVLANRVEGGVVAYQMAMTFFLLPHALLVHPVTTTLFPRLAAHARDSEWPDFEAAVSAASRLVALAAVAASVLLIAGAGPLLRLLRIGAIDRDGAALVGRTVGAYAVGLAGYALLFLLGRAHAATGDTRAPALVWAAVAVAALGLMVGGVAAVDGRGEVVAIGAATAAAFTGGAALQHVALRRRVAALVMA